MKDFQDQHNVYVYIYIIKTMNIYFFIHIFTYKTVNMYTYVYNLCNVVYKILKH